PIAPFWVSTTTGAAGCASASDDQQISNTATARMGASPSLQLIHRADPATVPQNAVACRAGTKRAKSRLSSRVSAARSRFFCWRQLRTHRLEGTGHVGRERAAPGFEPIRLRKRAAPVPAQLEHFDYLFFRRAGFH